MYQYATLAMIMGNWAATAPNRLDEIEEIVGEAKIWNLKQLIWFKLLSLWNLLLLEIPSNQNIYHDIINEQGQFDVEDQINVKRRPEISQWNSNNKINNKYDIYKWKMVCWCFFFSFLFALLMLTIGLHSNLSNITYHISFVSLENIRISM